MQESGFIEITPLLCILTIQGQYLAFSWSWILRAHHQVAAVAAHLMEISVCCWLKRQATFFFCPQSPRIQPPHSWLSSPSTKPYLIGCSCLVANSCLTLWSAACQGFLSFTDSWSLFKHISIESVMLFNHFTLCCSLLLLPSIFPSIRVFSNESALCTRWPKYWSFSFSNSPSNEYWFPLGLTGWISLQYKGLSRVFSSTIVLKHKFFDTQPSLSSNSHPYMTTGNTIALTI